MPHETRINDALKQLGEEHRLGMVALEEYRSRRRALLQSWGERDATTSPRATRTAESVTARHPALQARAGAAPAAAGGKRSRAVAIVLIAVALAAPAVYVIVSRVMKPEAPRAAQSLAPAPAPAPLSPAVVATKRAADRFLSNNVWEAGAVEPFLQQWRTLSPAERTRAREEPSLKTLRYQLQQNIDAESQLLTAESPPEQRARLEMLTRFAAEIDG